VNQSAFSERALIVAPRGRDAKIAAAILQEAGIDAKEVASLSALIHELDVGAAFLLVTEESLATADVGPLASWLMAQQEWSDFPFILLTRGGGLERNPAARRYLDLLGNVTFLERPFHPTTLVSLACSALRSRRRQYEAKNRLQALRESEAHFRFLDQLAELVQPLTDSSEIMARTARHLGEHLGIAVCAYADMEFDQDGFTIRGDWTAPGAASIVGFYKLSAFGEIAVKQLRAGRPLVTRDTLAELGAEQASLFLQLGLRATVCLPLVKDGRLTALMAVHSAAPRAWSDGELRLIEETTVRSWAHVERAGAEAALRQSESRFRAAVGAVQGLLWTNDALGRMTGEQPGWAALTGQSYNEYQGYGWADAVHPEDAQPTVVAWNQAVDQRSTFDFEHRVRRHDGEWRSFTIRAVPVLDHEGAVREWVGVHTDVTESRQAEAALREQTETLEILNRTCAAVAGELDLERVVQMVTDAGVELCGAAFGAFFYNVLNDAGESYMLYTLSGADRSAFHGFGMPRATAVFRPTFTGERVIRSDDILADPHYGQNTPHKGMPKGHLPVRSYLAVPVVSRSGEVVGGLFFGHPAPSKFLERHERLMRGLAGQAAVAIDNARLYQAVRRSNETLELRVIERTAELETAHEALRQSQKMETVGQLTGGVAHDFNNLLQIVTGNLETLQRNLGDNSPRLKRAAENAMVGAKRAAILTQRLLAFSRRQPLVPKPIDANKLVADMSELLHRTLGETIQLETVLASGLWRVEADPNQLENALLNLVVNARDAMPDGGKLTVETANTHLDRGYTSQNAEVTPGQYVVICVSDTGTGMDAATAARVFEPFFTTKEVGKGTGLGLSMVYGFVKQSGGHVKIYSELGHGTTVKIYLPRLLGKADDEIEAVDALVPEGTSEETVLVCEDDDDVRAYSVETLRELGYRVLEANDGPSALRLLERQEFRVDLLFSDVVLPSGMNGADLATEARRLRPNLKVLFTTGYARDAIVHQGRLDPGVELITKPFAYGDLAARVRDILDARDH
jgi:PAS domain S-box-containing protein